MNPEIARPGDWIEIHGHVQGEAPRSALVLEVLGTAGNEHYRVRWDEEHESILYPGPDAVIRPQQRKQAKPKPPKRKQQPKRS
jgi:hypothetical protein